MRNHGGCPRPSLSRAANYLPGKQPEVPAARPPWAVLGVSRGLEPPGAQRLPGCLRLCNEIKHLLQGTYRCLGKLLLIDPQRLASPASWREHRSGVHSVLFLKAFWEQKLRTSWERLERPCWGPFAAARAGDCVPNYFAYCLGPCSPQADPMRCMCLVPKCVGP